MTAQTPPVVDDTLHLIAATLLAHQVETDHVPRHGAHRWYCGCSLAEGGPLPSEREAYAGWVAHVAPLAAAALEGGAVWLGDGAEPALGEVA